MTSADSNRTEQNKNIFAIGSSTFVTIRNNNNVNIGMNPTQETVSLTKVIDGPISWQKNLFPISTF